MRPGDDRTGPALLSEERRAGLAGEVGVPVGDLGKSRIGELELVVEQIAGDDERRIARRVDRDRRMARRVPRRVSHPLTMMDAWAR
jgi:hypothetical protein